MTPIINPWIFYVINLINKFDDLLWAVIILLVSIGVLIIAIIIDTGDFEIFEGVIKSKLFKIYITLFVLCPLLVVIIPSKETMYTMAVAHYVTYENVETATDIIKDGVDYLFDKIDDDKNGKVTNND